MELGDVEPARVADLVAIDGELLGRRACTVGREVVVHLVRVSGQGQGYRVRDRVRSRLGFESGLGSEFGSGG